MLARADAGIDFSGTDYAFLESVPFLAALVALAAIGMVGDRLGRMRSAALLAAALAVVLGALEFAGSLAEEDYQPEPGLAAGAACGLFGFLAAATFVGRARERLATRGDSGPAALLGIYADGAALLLAALAIFVPPLSYAALALCTWVLLERRRRAGRKYEGLRVLR